MRGNCRRAVLAAIAAGLLIWLLGSRPWLQRNEAVIEAVVEERLRQAFAAGSGAATGGCPDCRLQAAAAAVAPQAHCQPCPSCHEMPAGISTAEAEVVRLRAELDRVESEAATGDRAIRPVSSTPSIVDTGPACRVQYSDVPDLDKYLGGCVAPKSADDDGECAGYASLEGAQDVCSSAGSDCAGITFVPGGHYEPRAGPELRDRSVSCSAEVEQRLHARRACSWLIVCMW